WISFSYVLVRLFRGHISASLLPYTTLFRSHHRRLQSRSSLHLSCAHWAPANDGEGPPLVERALAAVQHRFEPARRSVPVDVDHVDPHRPVGGQSSHHGPQRTRRAP